MAEFETGATEGNTSAEFEKVEQFTIIGAVPDKHDFVLESDYNRLLSAYREQTKRENKWANDLRRMENRMAKFLERAEKAEAQLAASLKPEPTGAQGMTLIQAKQLRRSAPHQACVSPNPNGDDKRCPLCRMADDIIRSEPPTLGAQGRADAREGREGRYALTTECMTNRPNFCPNCGKPIWGEGWNSKTGVRYFTHATAEGCSYSDIDLQGPLAVSLAPSEPVSPQPFQCKIPEDVSPAVKKAIGRFNQKMRELHPVSESPLPVQEPQDEIPMDDDERKRYWRNLARASQDGNKEQRPRRIRIDLFIPAERAIYDATQAVEQAGCDVRLTDAVILLSQARERVADFVDGVAGEDPREFTHQCIENHLRVYAETGESCDCRFHRVLNPVAAPGLPVRPHPLPPSSSYEPTLAGECARLLAMYNADELREIVAQLLPVRPQEELLRVALFQLSNEASGFLSMANRESHGNTNMSVLKLRIEEARALLKPRMEEFLSVCDGPCSHPYCWSTKTIQPCAAPETPVRPQEERVWMLMFEDPDRGHSLYHAEEEALEAYEKARVSWTCTLFSSVPSTPSPLVSHETLHKPAPRPNEEQP